jgi:thiamine-monophosphate kinase
MKHSMGRPPAEFALIERFLHHFPRAGPGLFLGPGDDCALLRPAPRHELCVTTDTVREGVHFGPRSTPEDIGHKALAVNLSDLAAMGARPRWFLAAIELPARVAPALVEGMARGMAALAREHRCLLAGGNLCRGRGVAVTVTALGDVPIGGALRRDGLRPGDLLVVTGTLGLAALGLRSLRRARLPRLAQRRGEAELAQLRPRPRVAAGLAARGVATAGIDISDGLAQDLGHLCDASRCGAELWSDQLPVGPLVAARRDWLSLCLAGGEDYELLLGVAPERWAKLRRHLERSGAHAFAVGRASARPGLWLARGPGGRAKKLSARGFSHF